MLEQIGPSYMSAAVHIRETIEAGKYTFIHP